MRGVNKCLFIGTLGQNPDVKVGANDKYITSFSIAINEQWKDKATGQQQTKTEWVHVVMFGKLAEIASVHLKKGSKVYIEGKMRTEKYQDRETGKDRYSTKVVADEMQMLDSKPEGAQPQRAAAPEDFGGSEWDIPI